MLHLFNLCLCLLDILFYIFILHYEVGKIHDFKKLVTLFRVFLEQTFDAVFTFLSDWNIYIEFKWRGDDFVNEFFFSLSPEWQMSV